MKRSLFPILFCLFLQAFLFAKNEKSISLQDEYDKALSAFQRKDWKEVVEHVKVVITEAPTSPFLSDLTYFAGVAYYHQGHLDKANHHFSLFLEKYAAPKYFEEAIIYKYQIAEQYEQGTGKHVMGMTVMPRLVSGWEDAYQLYDEVINTLSRHEVAAKALFHKAGMLKKDGKYPESIETYQTLIRRFHKHPLAPESYLAISSIYLEQSKLYFTDQDFLEQARLNLKKFISDFPREERLVAAETMLKEMMDRYAKDLWDSATYFQKRKKFSAAHLYYQTIIKKYPESHYAESALVRVEDLEKNHPELVSQGSNESSTNG